jgi:hypothetical protein
MLRKRLIKLGKRLASAGSELDPVVRRVEPYTLTSTERIEALLDAIRYVARYRIEGAIVECGVWRGGSMMAAALTLQASGDIDRDLYLYDTYKGMSPPGEIDRDFKGVSAASQLQRADRSEAEGLWCVASLEDVARNLYSTGYPRERIHFIEGPAEETIPAVTPARIARLRLDTDWYESTKHELEHLVPLLRPGGVLILDDYGHWEGARRAVDEYLSQRNLPLLLNRIDYTGRIAVMPRDHVMAAGE